LELTEQIREREFTSRKEIMSIKFEQ